MRIFEVPIQLDSEEKMFGGSLSLRKMIFLVVGGGFGALCFLGLYRMSLYLAALVWGLFCVLGCFLAFYRVKREYDIDTYVIMLFRYLTAKKDWPFYGGGE